METQGIDTDPDTTIKNPSKRNPFSRTIDNLKQFLLVPLYVLSYIPDVFGNATSYKSGNEQLK